MLHRNIRVKNEAGSTIIYLSEMALKPKANWMFVMEDVDDYTFMVALRKPPKVPHILQLDQPLDNMSEKLTIYKSYMKGPNYPYPPHRYHL